MEYGSHLDNGVMGSPHGLVRSDIAITIFLSDPASYAGGDPREHRILVDMGVTMNHMRTKNPDSAELKLVSAAYNNLLRL